MSSVLIIDDEVAIRGLLRAILEPMGYTIMEAVDGREGIRRFRASPTDLVITDMSMPRANGLTVIRELRAEYPSLRILVMSGAKTPDDLSEALRMGAVATLLKPFGAQEVRDAVARCLGGPTETPAS